jgi:hypothetical protein
LLLRCRAENRATIESLVQLLMSGDINIRVHSDKRKQPNV